ncbi:MAG: hypothetical protein PWQ55_44 [Chloroflexota bacterium]|nr:hypothetical protein [Chloroflexota bacterium]
MIQMRAGDADPGPLIRRRRREVALETNIPPSLIFYLTLSLRLPYDLNPIFPLFFAILSLS